MVALTALHPSVTAIRVHTGRAIADAIPAPAGIRDARERVTLTA